MTRPVSASQLRVLGRLCGTVLGVESWPEELGPVDTGEAADAAIRALMVLDGARDVDADPELVDALRRRVTTRDGRDGVVPPPVDGETWRDWACRLLGLARTEEAPCPHCGGSGRVVTVTSSTLPELASACGLTPQRTAADLAARLADPSLSVLRRLAALGGWDLAGAAEFAARFADAVATHPIPQGSRRKKPL